MSLERLFKVARLKIPRFNARVFAARCDQGVDRVEDYTGDRRSEPQIKSGRWTKKYFISKKYKTSFEGLDKIWSWLLRIETVTRILHNKTEFSAYSLGEIYLRLLKFL